MRAALAALIVWGGAGASWLALWWLDARDAAEGLVSAASRFSEASGTTTAVWWLVAAVGGSIVFATLALFAVRLADRNAEPRTHS
jgi:hypothetical protein